MCHKQRTMFSGPEGRKGIWSQISSTFEPNHIWIDQDQKSKPVRFTNKNMKHNLLPTYTTAYEDALFWFLWVFTFLWSLHKMSIWYIFKYCFLTCFRGFYCFNFYFKFLGKVRFVLNEKSNKTKGICFLINLVFNLNGYVII